MRTPSRRRRGMMPSKKVAVRRSLVPPDPMKKEDLKPGQFRLLGMPVGGPEPWTRCRWITVRATPA